MIRLFNFESQVHPSYGYTYDEAWRPKTLTGESLTLVDGVAYNAAGAMTAFTRNDGSGTPIVNGYTFNHLNQLTNQTVTKGTATLQNLTYTFHATQNNGQILSQTGALSAETILYQYDALQRLVSAETASSAWGLAWSYDGFGNRTNQSVTKGSAPMHSVAIDAATNRIATAGHQYDANGNLTQMPLMTMGYDIANRMVTSNHSGAGTQSYGYNHASQRVFVRSGDTVTYYLYGLGGERLMEFEETCTGGACSGYQENQRWIYFAGRRMFSKTGTTLKAITPTRLASEAKHFPYGETEGTPPSDTKDYFATYRRDATNLDYAWHRYYSPTMGRFTTADPYGGSADPRNPQSWNRYSYTWNNPVNYNDPVGTLPERIVFEEDPNGDNSQYYVPMAWFALSRWYADRTPPPGYYGFNLQEYFLARDDCFEAVGANLTEGQQGLLATYEKSWSDLTTGQRANFLNLTAALTDAGFDYSTLRITGIQNDRILFGSNPGFRAAVDSEAAKGTFLNDFLLPLSPAHGGYKDQGGFRQDVAKAPLQISFGGLGIDVDIDYWNGVRDAAGMVMHMFGEGLRNALTKSTTSPYNVARKLRERGVDLGHDCN